MSPKSVIPLIALMFIVVFSSFSFAIDTVDEVRPKVTAVFNEKVVLTQYFLIHETTGTPVPVSIVSQKEEKTFVFAPSKSLSNGLYTLTVFASDLIGNAKEYKYQFEVFVPGTQIFLIEPNSIGVANSTRFRVSIFSSRASECKYSGVAVSTFDDPRLKAFDITGNASSNKYVNDHSILEYTAEPGFGKRFFVMCKDDLGRENFKGFMLYADVAPPILTAIAFDPEPVVEYPPEGTLTSLLKVTASEPVLCKYTLNENASYAEMTPFEGFDINNYEAYTEQDTHRIYFPNEIIKETFTFYVQCEDRARFLSTKKIKTLNIDLTEGLKIMVTSPPPSSGNSNVFLNITTNRRAYCIYKASKSGTGDPTSFDDPASKLSSSFENLARNHYKNIGMKSEGSHSITIRCDVPEGVALEAMSGLLDYTYTIDKTPPPPPKVNATTPVCGNTLSAEFYSNDSSGISEYQWKVGAAGNIMANGSTSDTSVSVSKSNNGTEFELDATKAYIFSVLAVDGAGNAGQPGTSNQIKFDSTGISCDVTPPVIGINRSEDGRLVTLTCDDDASGCDELRAHYNTAYEEPCNSTQYFLAPVIVTLFKTTIICWDVSDKAGNINKGSKVIEFSLEDLNISAGQGCPNGIDNDGDGYGERCLLGPDCDDTDPEWSIGCLNGCVQDADGDGYGLGCQKGNDCNGKNPDLNVACLNGCLSDNDGDEFGLGCENGPDCKGDDSSLQMNCPNGCVDDNDGDLYGQACPADLDCHGENHKKTTGCDTDCFQDTDGDGYGMGCTLGLDCNGFNPTSADSCQNGCIFDEDGDGFGMGCQSGNDCNGQNFFMTDTCSNGCLSDNDGDGYGWGCVVGDCNDTNPYLNIRCDTECVNDHDGDGYGLGCSAGSDCDDYLYEVNTGCDVNCTYDEDCNGLPDDWQMKYFNNTVCDDTSFCGALANPDEDGYNNIEEYRRRTHPLQKDDVALPEEIATEKFDDDGDGMPDACEKMYGLSTSDPYDADKDPDGDGLPNSFECRYKEGSCVNWLNPKNPDHDNDGYMDNEEIDAGTDPCDPESYPSAGPLPLIMIILAVLMNIGSTGYMIYKRYYLPLVLPPPKPTVVPRQVVQTAPKQTRATPSGVMHTARPHRTPHKPVNTGVTLSRKRFEDELKKRASERDKLLSVFGERKHIDKPKKIMRILAQKPVEVRHVRVTKQEPSVISQAQAKDHVEKLSKSVSQDNFEKISSLTKSEADYFGRLVTITQKKEVPLEDDQVSKLTAVTKTVADDTTKQKELTQAFKKSDVEQLETFLSSRQKVDTFIKESAPTQSSGSTRQDTSASAKSQKGDDSLSALSDIASGKKSTDALGKLSKSDREEMLASLLELGTAKEKKVALTDMEKLSSVSSKKELVQAVEKMSRGKGVDKSVFEVLLSYLLNSGKISKRDVSEIMFDLEKQGVLSKKDIAEVFMNLGMKK
ncbi:MAG: thrombospondin type 3 repeat-containing protein [Candidatus Woesearchaeota archaeon]